MDAVTTGTPDGWAPPVPGRRNPLLLDVPLALLATGLELAELFRPAPAGSPLRAPDALGVVLVALACLPLAARRVRPRVTLAVVLVAAALVSVLGYRQSTFALGLMPALYTVGQRCRARDAGPLLAGTAALLVVSFVTSREPVSVADVVQAVVSVCLAWWVGASLRVRAAYAAAMADRAALVQQVHEEAAAAAVTRERMRIARELHDVVAHSMSVVAVQSGVAQQLVGTRPDAAREALDAVVASSRSALDELRQLLAVLRQDGSRGDLAPSPALEDLPALAAALRSAGLRVDLALPAPLPDLPPALGLTVYRVVQEALTNTVRHAGADAAAEVRVSVEDDARALVLKVEDRSGSGAARGPARPAGAGVGLLGMQERVALFGGTLETGPTPGGFAVRAVVPLPVRTAPGRVGAA